VAGRPERSLESEIQEGLHEEMDQSEDRPGLRPR